MRMWEANCYDETDWAYPATGRTLLRTWGAWRHRRFHVRPQHVFCSATGFGIPDCGQANVYQAGADGARLAAIRARQGLEALEPPWRADVPQSTREAAVSAPLPAASLLVSEPVR
jgi:hypothetical protein